MSENKLILTKEECAKIVAIPHLQNKPYNVASDHPFAGRSYNAYQYNGVPFTVASDSDFAKLHSDSIDLHSVTMQVGTRPVTDAEGVEQQAPSYQVLNCISFKQAARLRAATTSELREQAIQRAYRESKVTLNTDAELLKALQTAE
jgi:hypothetical protein